MRNHAKGTRINSTFQKLVSRAVGLGNTFREKLPYFQLNGEGRRGDGVHCVADFLSE